MKIYVMRHFERPSNITFFIELNKLGKQNAIKKIPEIENLNIDVIYSSPLVRTLQSIEPYARKHNVKVNPENSLYEFMEDDRFTLENYKHTVDEVSDKLKDILNKGYNSILHIDELEEPRVGRMSKEEYRKYINKRTTHFLMYLHRAYGKTDKNILLVTHKGTINSILEHNLDDSYETGKITEVNRF